ncbi:hypothetical protein R1sor_012781 [Riccia sorocarpa]|uniref:Isochorismatase-like domain-containing protein n=1 Tax=Riccia sorocarpa TaxID=122646 RepID=A0ABD3I8I2_9MARC
MGGSAGLTAQLRSELPLNFTHLELSPEQRVGLVIVDEVNGYCTVGAGNEAPVEPNKPISDMVQETSAIAKKFSERRWPILALLDTHEPDKPEHPYAPHCMKGSGEENLVPDLAWLERDEHTELIPKDCTDGFIGAFRQDGTNIFVEWVKKHQIETMVVVGICTELCVLDLVMSVLSARNHGMLSPLKHVTLYSKACATSDMPAEKADELKAKPHPQELFQFLGLYFAAVRGAVVVDRLIFVDGSKDRSESAREEKVVTGD